MADQGQNDRMTGAIDKAKDKAAGELSGNPDTKGVESAEHIKRTVDSMSTGNVPHGGDDPQHTTGNTQHSPMPSDTGGKGRVGDTSMKDRGSDR